MSRPFLEVEIENKWAALVRGPAAWELCRQAGRRKPPWSRKGCGWCVSEATARRVVELAELHGMGVVVAGARTSITDVPVIEASSTVDYEKAQGALW
jgi:hypothetical protein